MKYSLLYIASLLLGGAGAWLISCWGTTIGLLDRSNDRSSHEGVVPKGGGIGILAAFLFASWVLGLPLLFWISIGSTGLLSLYGDRSEIQPNVRLCFQFLAGIVLLVGIFHWEGRGWPMYVLIPVFSVFLVGTTNYYNFMDGIDGIAGIAGIVAFGLIALFGALSGANESLLILVGCMGFACLGFLPFNMPKARVFMGDVGSVLLGFVFAAMVVLITNSFLDFICLTSFLFPFYADELTTVVVRMRNKENLFRPHRMHLYQLLANELKIQHWKISVGYGLVQLLIGGSILIVRHLGIFVVFSTIILYFAGFAWVSYFVRRKIRAMGKDYKAAHSFNA